MVGGGVVIAFDRGRVVALVARRVTIRNNSSEAR